jgi:hypothetical protein
LSDFEKEKQELREWRIAQQAEADKIPLNPGLDGPWDARTSEIAREFYRRLRDLKAKYGVADPPAV